MPLLKKIIKSDPREVVVKWTGSGTDTLTLASLIATNQTVTGTPSVTIDDVSCTNSGATTVTRNAEVTLQINGNYEYNMNGIYHGTLNENSTFDIAISMVAVGTLILRLRKLGGYSNPLM
jgi:hypothetical protein